MSAALRVSHRLETLRFRVWQCTRKVRLGAAFSSLPRRCLLHFSAGFGLCGAGWGLFLGCLVGKLLAVGDVDGTVTVLSLCKGLHVAAPNEKALVGEVRPKPAVFRCARLSSAPSHTPARDASLQAFDREARREKNIEISKRQNEGQPPDTRPQANPRVPLRAARRHSELGQWHGFDACREKARRKRVHPQTDSSEPRGVQGTRFAR